MSESGSQPRCAICHLVGIGVTVRLFCMLGDCHYRLLSPFAGCDASWPCGWLYHLHCLTVAFGPRKSSGWQHPGRTRYPRLAATLWIAPFGRLLLLRRQD